MNRTEALKYLNSDKSINIAVISISSFDDEYPVFINESMPALMLRFDDVDKGYPNCITENDAKQIVEFINKTIANGCEKLIVHCGAGISRSAGVAGAIMKYIHDDDRPIFKNPKYRPNIHCYRMVLNEFNKKAYL